LAITVHQLTANSLHHPEHPKSPSKSTFINDAFANQIIKVHFKFNPAQRHRQTTHSTKKKIELQR